MQTTHQHNPGVRDCPYTFRGTNLCELRRHELNSLAGALKVPVGTGREMRLALIEYMRGKGLKSGPVEQLVG